ncbi:MAG TPA: hypothetical protein VKR22_07305, partial [Acidimicrobiales bacterium]|nr:hypothetical protein [Acidimicrobiales bacterium]
QGVPCATGVVPVGDAWGFTNPSLGRGISLGVMHAVDVVPEVVAHLEDPAQMAETWARATEGRAAPWHEATVQFDSVRGPEVEAARLGLPDPTDPGDPTVAIGRALATGSRLDRDVLGWLGEILSCVSLPGDILGRPGAFEKLVEVAGDNPPYATPGPDRAELESLLV